MTFQKVKTFLVVFLFFCLLANPQSVFSLYAPGSFNSWALNATSEMNTAGMPSGFERITVSVSDSDEFKIVTNTWGTDWGYGSTISSWDNVYSFYASGANTVVGGFSGSGYLTMVSPSEPNVGGNQNFGLMKTSSVPVSISSMALGDVHENLPVSVSFTLSGSKCAEEDVWVRYTTDSWGTSGWVSASGSGTSYSADIPAQSSGTTVIFYGMTSTATEANLSVYPDLLCLSFCNSSGGTNFSYTVLDEIPHTIAIDGVNDFFTWETLKTTTAGYTNYLSWDDDFLYLGYFGADVDASDRVLMFYFSTNEGSGLCYGEMLNTQAPVLPFKADFAIRFNSDYSWDSAVSSNDAWVWSEDPFDIQSVSDLFRSGDYMEMRIAKTNFGSSDFLDYYAQMVNTTSMSEETYGAVPSDALSDGYDSNPSNYLSFGSDIWNSRISPSDSAYESNDNVLPSVTLVTPMDGAEVDDLQLVDVNVDFTDNIGAYKAEIYTNATLYCTIFFDSVTESLYTNVTVSGPMASTIDFYALVYDTKNVFSSQTNQISFAVNEPPPAPALTYPTDADGHFPFLKPRFFWTIAEDTEGDAISNFQIIVSENSDLSSPEFSYSFFSLETNFLTPFTNYLNNSTTYYWSVRANDGNQWGEWSETNDFTIDPEYIVLDASLSEWPEADFSGDNSDLVTNGAWRWRDAESDTWLRTLSPSDHLDLQEFAVTADENALFFMFKVPDLSVDSPRTSLSVAIDTNLGASSSGSTGNAESDSFVSSDAAFEFEIIANVDGTGYYSVSGSETNFHECGENWITHTTAPGFGEIAVPWFEMGIDTIPERLRMTVSIGRVLDGLGVYEIEDISGVDFVDAVSTNGDTSNEFSDETNNCYFEVDFDDDGQVLAHHFEITAPESAFAGVPFAVVVTAEAFFGGAASDYDRTLSATLLSNGNARILSSTPWVNGISTNYVVLNTSGTNAFRMEDAEFPRIFGQSAAIFVMRPDLHLNEWCIDSANGQWFELFNRGDENVYLTNWALHDEDSSFPLLRIEEDIVLPSSNFIVIQNGSGSDDLDFSDGRGLLYESFSDLSASDQISLYCTADFQSRYTLMDFVAYGADAGSEDDLAVDAEIWTDGDFIDTSGLAAENSLILLGDGDDNDLSSDWSLDHSPTPRFSNLLLVISNLSAVSHDGGIYPGSSLFAFELTIPDPENDTATDGDAISNLSISLSGNLDDSDISSATLWNANGASKLNLGNANAGENPNLLMGEGSYAAGVLTFTGLSNSTIVHDASGGEMTIFLALTLSESAVIGHSVNPFLASNSVVMASSYPDSIGPADGQLSNSADLFVYEGGFTINEFSDAKWVGAGSHAYQFVELYNFEDNALVASNWSVSTSGAEDEIGFYRGSSIASGEIALLIPGGASTATWESFYSENNDSPLLTNDDFAFGGNGLLNADRPLILREAEHILKVLDYTNSITASGDTVEKIAPLSSEDSTNYEASSFTNGTPGYFNGFLAVEMNLIDVTTTPLDIFTTNNLVLDFEIPASGAAQTLSMLTIKNNGSAIDSDAKLSLFSDGASIGFDGDENDWGDFTYSGSGSWTWSGSENVPATGSRLFITATIPSSVTDGRTLRLSVNQLLPEFMSHYDGSFTNGCLLSGFHDGPVDSELSNQTELICGIADLQILKSVESVELSGYDLAMPGSLLTFEMNLSNHGHGNGTNVVIYDRIPENTVYMTNHFVGVSGWEVQFAHVLDPDQSYDSADYDSVENNVFWIRFRKKSVAPDDDGLSFFVGVMIE